MNSSYLIAYLSKHGKCVLCNKYWFKWDNTRYWHSSRGTVVGRFSTLRFFRKWKGYVMWLFCLYEAAVSKTTLQPWRRRRCFTPKSSEPSNEGLSKTTDSKGRLGGWEGKCGYICCLLYKMLVQEFLTANIKVFSSTLAKTSHPLSIMKSRDVTSTNLCYCSTSFPRIRHDEV